MPAKRVLFVRSNVNLAGPGVLMHGSAIALRQQGWTVEVASGGGALVDRFEGDGIEHNRIAGLDLGDRSIPSLLAGAQELRRLIKKFRPQVIHSFNAQAGLLVWFATRGLGPKIVNTVLGAGKEMTLRYMPFPLIAVSEFVRDDLLRYGVRSDRIFVVYNGIIPDSRLLASDEAFDALWSQRDADPAFRFVGIAMMNADKGQRATIEALARLREERPTSEIRLKLVGDGNMRRELEAFARERGQSAHVTFAGAQSDVYPFLDQGHAFIHLTHKETFGMVLAEAQARGLPAIAYAIGGIPEVVLDGVSGMLADCDDLDAVVAAMRSFVDDRALARRMGRAGLDRTRAMFTIPELGLRLEEVYAGL